MNPLYERMSTSVFERMSALAAKHGAVNLGQGFPDFGWPDEILDAAARALRQGSNQYAPSRGLPALREAVAAHYGRQFGQQFRADHVCVTSGATEALGAAILATVEPGDEVIILTPAYDSYAPMIRRSGGVPREVALQPPAWRIDRAALEAAVGAKTRAILFNNPHNPAGRSFDAEELEIVASIARDHDLVVISDEVWEHITLDGGRFSPLASLPDMAGRTIKIGSAGKIFSLTGWKVGWMVAAPELAGAVARAHQFLTFCTPPNLQAAVAFGLNEGDSWIAPMKQRFERARDRMTQGLRGAGFTVLDAAATYFLCVDLAASGFMLDDEAFAAAAVEQAGVAVVPLSAFAEHEPPRHLVRLCFGKKDETIDQGVAAMAKAKALLRSPADEAAEILGLFGVQSAGKLVSLSPIDGKPIGRVTTGDPDLACETAAAAFPKWREVPAPRRGELVRLLGDELRQAEPVLAEMITLEAGKILQESLGEVQEMIDICDYAVGLSRQLYGLTIASERPKHRMMEQWHPLGPVLVISAFNFPVAVWAWNAALALVCGDPVVWKPSEKTPLTAELVMQLVRRAMRGFDEAPDGLIQLVQGERDIGEALVDDPRIALVSATGSTAMGRAVGPRVAQRFGRVLLELGGNNAMIVCPSADLELAARAILFSAVGTAGQRCTTLRRLIVHDSVADQLVERLRQLFGQVKIGDPRLPDTLVGPLIDEAAFEGMQGVLGDAIERVEGAPGGFYVRPAIVEADAQAGTMLKETFAPILYALRYRDFEEAIALNNAVPQGLSSSIFTSDVREAERFMSAGGSDCGIANVNIGPSGAEIGGAFGGEKETGGGRESGSDSWRAYMRRQTNTINYGADLPLAQGVRFDIAP